MTVSYYYDRLTVMKEREAKTRGIRETFAIILGTVGLITASAACLAPLAKSSQTRPIETNKPLIIKVSDDNLITEVNTSNVINIGIFAAGVISLIAGFKIVSPESK